MTRSLRLILACAVGLGVIGALAAVGFSAAPSSRSATAGAKHGPPYTIYLSNTLATNGWRLEMQSIVNLLAKTPPYDKLVNFRIINGDNTVPGQIASLNAALPSHPDAILIDANSPTALNPVLQRAIQQGAIVISFDNLVTLPQAYKLTVKGGMKAGAYSLGLWLANSMHGKGNVVINNGVLGTGGEQLQNAGAMAALKKFPGIKVVAQFAGDWSTATSAQKFAEILSTHPNIDGVWDWGGEIGVIQDLLKAKHPLIPVAGYTFNKYFQYCLQYKAKGLQCGAASYPSTLGALALQTAVKMLQGKKYPNTITVPYTFYTNNGVKTDVPSEPVAWGTVAFKDLPDEFTTPYSPPGVKLDAHKVAAGMK